MHPSNRAECRTEGDVEFHLARRSIVLSLPPEAAGLRGGHRAVSPERGHRLSLESRPGICASTLGFVAGRRAALAKQRASWRSKHNTSAARLVRIPAQLRQSVD